MKKSFIIFMALVLTFFTMPFGGITALADEKVYDNIEDGEYEIDIKLLKKGTDEKSAAAGFMNEAATLIIEDGKLELTFYIPNNPMMKFNKFEVEKLAPAIKEVDDMFHYNFKLNELKTNLSSIVSYEVPMMNLVHDDVGMDIELVGLDELPKEEAEEPESAPEEREVGKLLTEKEADAVYQLNYETESQATAGQLENPVKLLEKNSKAYIQIPINEGGAEYFRSLKFNGKEVTWNSITEGPYKIQFELPNGIEDELDVSMVIQAGPNAMPHDDIKLWFDEDSLETIKEPETKPEQPDAEAPEEREVGQLLTEEEADAVYELNYATDSKATEAQLKNPVKLLKKDNKEYVQIEVNDRGAPLFRSLKFNDKEVIWSSITEGPYNIQFELPNGIEDELKVSMVIQAGPNVMPHDNIKLWFEKDSLKTIKEPETPEEPDSELDPKELAAGVYTLNYSFLEKGKDTASSMDSFTDGPAYVKVDEDGNQLVAMTFTNASMIKWFKVNGQEVTVLQEDETKDTRIVEFPIQDLTNKHVGSVFVEVPGLYSTEHMVDLVFATDSLETTKESEYPEKQTVDKPINPDEPEKPDEDPKDDPKEDPTEKPKEPVKSELEPDKAFEIDYVIKQEDGVQNSVSNNFFTGEAILLEKDGKTYVQLTIENGDMIKGLQNKYGEAILIEENEDGTIIVQLRVNNDLSDMLLDMHIVVPDGAIPGFPGYDEEHKAMLVFDKDSKKEIDVGNYRLAGSDNTKPNPEKPVFGDGDDTDNNGKDTDKQPGKNDNPQTGDTTNILLYAMLLIGSLIPLAEKLRRRFN